MFISVTPSLKCKISNILLGLL